MWPEPGYIGAVPTHVKDVSVSDFAHEVLERSFDVPVVVDFWAQWCGPCKILSPTLERLVDEGGGSWELAKVDVDANPELAQSFGVQGIPTVVALRDGRIVSQFTGAIPEAQVRDFIAGMLPTDLDLAAERGHLALEAGNADAAEATWRTVLAEDPTHEGAAIGLAGLLLERGDAEEALGVLAPPAPSEAVRQLQAAARLHPSGDLGELEAAATAGDLEATVAFAKSLVATGRIEEALGRLVDVVAARAGEVSEAARATLLDLFELLGPAHPLTAAYRRKLASALF